MKKYIATAVMIGVLSFGSAQASALTQGQVNAIISILQAFGVDSVTVANVQNDLTINITIPNATTASIIPTVTYKTWVPANLQTPQSQPVQQPVQITVTAPTTTEPIVNAAPVILPTAAPVIPAVTISQVSTTTAFVRGEPMVGSSILTAGPDEVEIDTVTITVTGDPTQVSNVVVTANNQFTEMGSGYTYESSIKLYPTTQWYMPQIDIPAGGTLTVNIGAQGPASAQVVGYTGTDLTTGATITQ